MDFDDSILQEFLGEAQDHFESIEDDFLLLTQQIDDPDPEVINKVFRAIHSVKGGAGFLELHQLAKLTHIMETLLSAVRAGGMPLTTSIIDALLAGVDMVNSMLSDLPSSNDMDIDEIHNRLNALIEGEASPEVKRDMADEVSLEDVSGNSAGFEINKLTLKNLPPTNPYLFVLQYDLEELAQEKGKSPVALIRDLLSMGEIVDAKLTPGAGDLIKGLPKGPLRYDVLYSTILEPGIVETAVGLPSERVISIDMERLKSEGALPGPVVDLFGELAEGEEAEATEAASAPRAEPKPEPKAQPKAEARPVSDSPVKPAAKAVAKGRRLPVSEEVVVQFVQEADESLEQMEQLICDVFEDPASAGESMDEAYRLIHSFKGNCGLLSLPYLEAISHSIETVLDFFKGGVTPRRDADRSTLLNAVDALKTGIGELGSKGVVEGDPAPLVAELESLLPSPVVKTSAARKPRPRPAGDKPAVQAVERKDIRVDLGKLDVLINLVGELVIAESMVTRNSDLAELELENFEKAAHNLRRIIMDLQDVAMAVRMIPLSRTFRKMIRLVHDLSRKAGKKVKLDLLGEETEVDKTVIEQIADPLVHIIRNAVDHGVETPAERLNAGKGETGRVLIGARHEGGEVLIEVEDDGRGLSREKIVAKGINNGLIKGDGSDLSDDEVYKLIFEPGFSTADKITDVSGRGVGMDVVKRNLDRLKGRVDVRSSPGHGSTVTLRIPLTLAIIEGMLIRVGAARYTLPLLSILESFRPTSKQITVTMDGQETVKVREDLIPVIRLHEIYEVEPDERELDRGILVTVNSGSKKVCLFADEILGQHQTVIKAMPDYLGKARGLSGCTILGDGEVSLILDVGSIIELAENSTEAEEAYV